MADNMKHEPTFSEVVETLLGKLREGSGGALRTGVVAGGIGLAALTGLAGCGDEDADEAGGPPAEIQAPNIPVPGQNKADWAQAEGERDTNMVSYMGEYWTEYQPCYERFCNSVDVMLKLRVRPVDGADIGAKRVGIVATRPGFTDTSTFMGEYFTTMGDGTEEWHVRVGSRANGWGAYFPLFTFTAWYQDGKSNTFYDDNQGEFHAVSYTDRYRVLSQVWCCSDELTNVNLTDSGVEGRIRLMVGNLDFDKDIRLFWTTDEWATVGEYGMGSAEEVNSWHWVSHTYGGSELWEMNLEIQGDFQKFEYAVVYRHGVVNNAIAYEFWDNNGGRNYVVTRAQPEEIPITP